MQWDDKYSKIAANTLILNFKYDPRKYRNDKINGTRAMAHVTDVVKRDTMQINLKSAKANRIRKRR